MDNGLSTAGVTKPLAVWHAKCNDGTGSRGLGAVAFLFAEVGLPQGMPAWAMAGTTAVRLGYPLFVFPSVLIFTQGGQHAPVSRRIESPVFLQCVQFFALHRQLAGSLTRAGRLTFRMAADREARQVFSRFDCARFSSVHLFFSRGNSMIRVFSAAAFSSAVDASSAINIVVVDPRFDAYQSLATAAKLGRCSLHFRASGRAALHLLSKRRVEAVIVGEVLDDMTGHECVALLRAQHADASPGAEAPVVLMAAESGGEHVARPAGGCDATFSRPITIRDVEDQVRIRRRGRGVVRIPALLRAMGTLPVGVCAAAVSIAALLLI